MLRQGQSRPIRVRRDDNFPPWHNGSQVIIVICGLLSWGSNLVAWNLDFPTILESRMWRANSLILIVLIAIGGVCYEILLKNFPDMRKKSCDRFAACKRSIVIYESKQPLAGKFGERFERHRKRLVFWLSNNSPNGDPSLTICLRVILPFLFCCVTYTIARSFLLVADLIAFRSQNPDVSKTVNWANLLPHV